MKLPYAIVKSFVMVPDIIGKGTLFFTEAIRNSSLAGYLPMFSVAGVAAFFFANRRRRDWRKTLFITCAVIAVVPFFNAAFSLFNNHYYARWFYMPILFMAMVTAQQLERGQNTDLKLGAVLSVILFLFMLTVALLPSKNSEGEIVYLNMTDNPSMFWNQVKATGFLLVLLVLIVYLVNGRARKMIAFFAATIIACVLSTMTVLHNGAGLINDFGMTEWKMQMLDTRPELEDGTFFRVETDSTSTNYEMAWGLPTIHCFLSTVPSEIFGFYYGMCGIERGVESDAPMSRVGLRAILSARYYLENTGVNDSGEFAEGSGMAGYVFSDDQNDFAIYENKNCIPMGFTYHYYVRESVFDTVTKSDADRMMVKAVVLSDKDAERYGSLMNELPDSEITEVMSDEVFTMECTERKQTACTRFETDTHGFTATTANLPEENLVFFAVPAAKGFTASLDGRKTKIIRADYGMMAIDVP
ncbi:MAG: YfhO family protein, partial [Lachnospiraceae bacterium]|nr:YfhO family protein [Lachnospiraceae bacterium]